MSCTANDAQLGPEQFYQSEKPCIRTSRLPK
jgi:hypothetical protein